MATLFVHDHVFFRSGNDYYSEGKLTYRTWQRFLDHDNDLTVVGRYKNTDSDIEGLSLSSGPGVNFQCIPSIRIVDRMLPQRKDNFLLKHMENCDNVICRLPSFLGARAFYLAKKLSKNAAVEIVGCPYDALNNHGSVAGKLLAWPERFRLKRIAAISEFSFYVTRYFLQNRYPTSGRSHSISNVELGSVTEKIKIQEEANRMAFIGSLSAKYKRLSDLIKATKELSRTRPNIELHILGSGNTAPYQALARDLGIERNVIFCPPIKGGNLVLEWLRSFDLYVQPSSTEGLPRALIEAMSVGLPCVATSVGGIPELLGPESLMPPKNVKKLYEVLQKFISSRELREEQSLRNFEIAKTYRYELLYRKRKDALEEFYRDSERDPVVQKL